MLVAIAVATLALSQRPSAPPKPRETKPTGSPVSIASPAPRTITAGYLRMNDPGFVVRTLDRATTPQGRRAAERLLPPEFIARRDAIVAMNAKYLNRVKLPTKPVTLGKPGKAPDDGSEPKGPGPIKLGGVVDVPMDFGSVGPASGAGAYCTLDYHGVALNSGPLTIEETWGSQIDVTRVNLYTGEIKDGKPVLAATNLGSQKGKIFSLKQGQEYLVRVRLLRDKIGTVAENIVLNEPGRTVRLLTKGVIQAKSGPVTTWIEDDDFSLTPGKPVPGKLHIRAEGNYETNVQVTGKSTLPGIQITGGVFKVQPGETVVPFMILAPMGSGDGKGVFSLVVSAYEDKVKTAIGASVKVETLWTIWDNFKLATGNVKIAASFIYSSAGDWELVWNGVGTSKFIADDTYLIVHIDTPTPQGTHLAAISSMRLEASVLTNDKDSAAAAGWDQRLVGTQYVNSFLSAHLIRVDWLVDEEEPLIKAWTAANKLVWLNGTEVGLQNKAK